MSKRLGLDIGTNSIGWWLYETRDGSPIGSLDGGVRIFSDGRDPKSKESLAKDRRAARAARRRRDRYLRRRASLMRKLARAGLMPLDREMAKTLEALDPFELRARGLTEPLSLHEFGRALFHLNQRRGFKSNRKTDRGDNESGKIKDAAARLDQAMMAEGAKTLGAFLHQRRAASPDRPPAVRTRLQTLGLTPRGAAETGYDFYPERRHLEDEFDRLWEAQAVHHQELTEALRGSLFETIFHQRPLKAPVVGRCLYFEDRRLAKAHPLYQRRVLLETVNALRVVFGAEERPLTMEERDRALLALDGQTAKSPSSSKISFARLRKAVGLTTGESFSHERQARPDLPCDAVRAIMAHKTRFGPSWTALSAERQWRVIARIRRVETDAQAERLVARLMREHGLVLENAQAVLNAPLPEGHGRIGLKATRALLPILQREVIVYSRACEEAFSHHSDFRTGEVLERLPYYGQVLDRHVLPGSNRPQDDDVTRYGRITNPTVHIGLGQLRHVVNAVIDRHGLPDRIVVELGRDLKLSQDQKRELEVVNRRNREDALRRGDKLRELGQKDTGANRLILRLWEKQGEDPLPRFCPYSGKIITAGMLFDGSVEVDHILPFSRTLDDSIANKVLCTREANRDKRNRSPWEAFGQDAERWATIAPLIERLPTAKRWRFAKDAMARFEGERDFLARQLVDMQYLSRISREYLSRLYPEKGTAPVYVVPGRMTEMLRRQWGLNFDLSISEDHPSSEKKRTDHRHHAIDAAVVGAIDQGLMARIQKASGRRRENGTLDVVADLEPPYAGFREDVRAILDAIVVSHRPDHGRIAFEGRAQGRDSTAGALHKDTAYGLTEEVSSTGAPIVVTRKPLDALKLSDIPNIRDPQLSALLECATRGLKEAETKAALSDFAKRPGPYQGIRRVRLLTAMSAIGIKDREGRPYKGVSGNSNHVYEVWRLPDGSWERVVVSTFDAHRPDFDSRPHPAAKRLMRIHKNDLLALHHPKTGTPMIALVQQFGEPRLVLAPHNEANVDARARDKSDPFDMIRMSLSTFRRCQGRLIHVDMLGRIHDPGPFE
ncbi:type II CRISPR RNA-guided endonuclease Cas9 [Albimonas sp. CAU 1670]|uniref:type II CRISPR RNA-guided endonuclease Cas9 n=1 Tax=Albimonas sp. CAU 1670 TaxID=3032599 RepID=UPI0023D9CCD1|nr:type II CRISPR RNA-guided endonuclease Cas9 [Albimonas sp. CAU 1670]MDF2235762.1 type II CRISPR RNA-guided endonuclease Cas9 [Albimonas sp. CAU 1670]